MDTKLMTDFEELEGMVDQKEDHDSLVDDNDDDDANFKPQQASTLPSADIYFEMDKRGLKTTGFPDTDREILQKAFDEEFKQDMENARARRREGRRRAARQAGLQRRRMNMERMLQEEETEMARDGQIGLLVSLVKENRLDASIRVDISSIGARALAKALWENTTITCIDLSSNDLSDHSGSYLARILKKNNTLAKLELDNNNLGPSSAHAFAEALRVNTSLVYLSLDSNPLTAHGSNYTGFVDLTKSLRQNSTLKSLNLWRVGAGTQGGAALANSIRANQTLLFCDVSHNSIDMADVKRIADQLDMNLAAYAAGERSRRNSETMEAVKAQKIQAQREAVTKEEEMKNWLESRRVERSANRMSKELERQLQIQAEIAERERKEAEKREADRKAQEEADAKKKKKKTGKK